MVARRNWLWIALIFILVNSLVFLYLRYTKNVFESSSVIQLELKSNATGFGIRSIEDNSGVAALSGELEMIQSRLFLSRVADSLHYRVSFYGIGRVLNEELFRNCPVRFQLHNTDHSMYDVPVNYAQMNERSFELTIESTGQKFKGNFGEPLEINDLVLTLTPNPDFQRGSEVGYYFTINSKEALTNYLASSLIVEPLNVNAKTIRIAFTDHNATKAREIVNKIDSLYLFYSNEQKNLENNQKIEWLTRELHQIEQRMEDYENYFETFTIRNKTNDLNEDLKRTIQGINSIDSQRYETTRRIAELDKIITSLEANTYSMPVVIQQSIPAPVIAAISELQNLKLQLDKLHLSYNETTFAYRQKSREIETLKTKTLKELRELKNSWLTQLSELNRRKAFLEKQFADLPDKNTQFSKNQRFYKLYEDFYLTLMKSKSEFEIAQAGTTPDFKILSSATLPAAPFYPNRLMVHGAGFVMSIALGLLCITILYLVNNKITSVNDLEKQKLAPLLGIIPESRYMDHQHLHLKYHPKSMVSEAIRTLRTNLDFFNIASESKVIAISSTISGEGKSFIASNLAGVLALSRKKVLLIDLDMRKLKINSSMPMPDADKGVSTVLIRKNHWKECIIPTELENLHYIPPGPQPPNPSELLLNGEFEGLLTELKKEYQYIILDTPPVGLVTDGIMAMKRADLSVYVFRANYSKTSFISNLKRITSINKFSNITVVLNAVPTHFNKNGYGYYEELGSRNKLKLLFKRG